MTKLRAPKWLGKPLIGFYKSSVSYPLCLKIFEEFIFGILREKFV